MQSNFSDKYVHDQNVEILNLFDPELQVINTKQVIKNKLKELLNELKSLKFRQYQTQTKRKEMIVKSSIRVLN